jgi:hypothetical protein
MTANRCQPASRTQASHSRLVEIADVLDALCRGRTELDPASIVDERPLRAELFELVDNPTQAQWDLIKGREIAPRVMAGLSTPSPLGLTLADAVYGFGLPDQSCPDQSTLLDVLRWTASSLQRA